MSGSTTAFFSSETTALERQVELNDEKIVGFEQIWNETHKKICNGWIRQHGYKRTCLQFPDSYLIHSTAIMASLKEMLTKCDYTKAKLYILADTSYSSCCVDDIAAAHVDSDSIIHFGNACRSKKSGIPVLYMFPHLPLDFANMEECFLTLEHNWAEKEVYVYLDINYHYLLEHDMADADEESFNSKLRDIVKCKCLHVDVYPSDDDSKSELKPSDDRICMFVGADNMNFFNLSVTSLAESWFLYNPCNKILEKKRPLKANYIKRRYYYIEKCKDAKTLGLLVATLTSEGYLDIVKRLQEMGKSHGKRTQIISVGRINPAKLANFMEIDCFVLIGCSFNNMYTCKDFYKPIVSVFEAEMAMNPAWHMKYPESYVTDFKELLPQGKSFLDFDANAIRHQDISLVSGKMRNTDEANTNAVGTSNSELGDQSREVMKSKMEIMTTNVGLTFEDRTWKGLDPALGNTEPAKLTKGLSGIPMRYTHE